MYSIGFLKDIPYFEEYHKIESSFTIEDNFENILDSLTGLISRKYIIGYAKYLIEQKSPFRLMIIDLDNFKQINDNYGHNNGDKVLRTTSLDLMRFIGKRGLCGRFGGDEYLVVLNGDFDYNSIYDIIRQMFQTPKDGTCSNVFRKTLKYNDFQPFITATLGAVQYPEDAITYDDLFLAADKALYRGKEKGRNCYIIYLKDKHEHIDINKLKKKSILDGITRLNHFAENKDDDICLRVRKIFEFLREFISSNGTYYIEPSGYCRGFNIYFNPEYIDELLNDNKQFVCSQRVNIIENKLFDSIKEANVSAFILQKCVFNGEAHGYIIVFDKEIHHIWQEEDALITYCAAHLIAELKYFKMISEK